MQALSAQPGERIAALGATGPATQGDTEWSHTGRGVLPDIRLLDEPTSALDLRHQLEAMDLLRELAVKASICIVAALHDLNHALRFTDWTAILHQACLEGFGATRDVLTPAMIAKVCGVHTTLHQSPQGRSHLLIDGPSRPPNISMVLRSSIILPSKP